ncbi:VOC family protein [Buttiauxella noackiae]|uniref:VOC family protein n=1 Tax=Buttiauxella noackiae TaxID=82992 RepID=UPI0035A5A3F9
MNTEIKGGIDIAIKVPSHQYQQTLDFYRNAIGLKEITDKAPATGFVFGPNRLWIDEAPGLSQAEVWLELFTPDFKSAEAHIKECGVVRCDAVEPLPEGFKGGWVMSPCNIVHMLREPEAW